MWKHMAVKCMSIYYILQQCRCHCVCFKWCLCLCFSYITLLLLSKNTFSTSSDWGTAFFSLSSHYSSSPSLACGWKLIWELRRVLSSSYYCFDNDCISTTSLLSLFSAASHSIALHMMILGSEEYCLGAVNHVIFLLELFLWLERKEIKINLTVAFTVTCCRRYISKLSMSNWRSSFTVTEPLNSTI